MLKRCRRSNAAGRACGAAFQAVFGRRVRKAVGTTNVRLVFDPARKRTLIARRRLEKRTDQTKKGFFRMGQEDQALHELCRRVAADIPGAREEFAERVAPLLELLAKRSLATTARGGNRRRNNNFGSEERSDSAPRPSAASADRNVKIARLSKRLCRSLIEKVRDRHRLPGAETCAYRLPWPTEGRRSGH